MKFNHFIHFWIILHILVEFCPSHLHAAKSYKLDWVLDQSLNVSIGDGVQIFAHTTNAPFIYVGAGQIDFREFRGNFFINNYEQGRIGLQQFTPVANTSTSDTFRFNFGNSVNLNVTFATRDGYPLVISFSDLDPNTFNGIWMRVAATTDEKVYGLGEQYSYLNLRGRSYPIWVREQGVGRNKSDIVTFFADNYGGGAGGDYHTTYFPQTTFVSSRKYSCHYGGYNYAEVNFIPQTFHEIYIYGQPRSFNFDAGSTIKEVVQSIALKLGTQPELPDWVYTGAILGVQGGTQVMLDRLAHAQNNNVSVSGLWIQDWAGILQTSFGKRLFWDWKWNQTYYPDLNNTIASLKKQGIRVLAYINPNLNVQGTLFQEGARLGHFIRNVSGDPFLTDFGEFYCATVDLTSPDARMWYKGVIQKNMMDLGLSGWMADFGEYVPADGAFFYSNETGRVVHNKWPRLWAEVNRMATDESNVTGDVVFWMRAGAAGVGNYTTLMWAGDQNVDFSYADGLPSTIPAALNMGMSGVGITHFDIGGYTTAAQFRALGQALVRSDELLLRSAEAAVFTPMFRSHEGNQPQANVQFYSNDYIEQQFGRLSRMFVHIANYTRHVVQENSLFGTPAQRPLFMEFPDDPAAWAVTYQYMYGDKVLVAPVIATNVTSQTVYLPKGPGSAGWHFLWSDRSYPGGQFANVPAPIGQPPVFYLSSPEYDDIFTAVKRKFPLVQPPPPTTPHAETSTVSTKSTNSCTSVHVLNSLIMMCVVLHVF